MSEEAGESRRSKGGDGLRRTGPRQLSLVFADSPSGGGQAEPPDVSERRSFLLHKARSKKTTGPAASAADTSRLLEEVASEANLATALLNVVRNKGAPGVDGQTVEEAEAKAPSIIGWLRQELLTERYRPGKVRRVWLDKPGGGQRGLGIPNVVDRTVQQAVLQILEPLFEPTFHDSSHGFRPNRGAHTAVAEAKGYLKDGYQTVVDLDLAGFFDHVHHQRLLARIAQRVKDKRVIRLIRLMLTAPVVMPDGTTVAVREGTPQGGPLSPCLSNIVLDELDRELARRGLRFVRYADDCNIFVRSERAGQRIMASLRNFLEKRMRLQVNEAKSNVRKPEDVAFLGFSFRCTQKGQGDDHVAVFPSRKAERRLKTIIRAKTPPNWGRSIAACLTDISRYLNGWMTHFRLCTSEAVEGLRVIDAHVHRRIRAIIVRHRKRERFLFRHLVSKGVSRKAAANCAYCGKRAWVKSNRPAMTRAYPPSWFKGRMVSLKDRWHDLNSPLASAQLSLEL
jgi:RNA-directed DNA polymerase